MWRKIAWALTILYNFIRSPLSWIFNGGKIKISYIELISPKARIAVANKGTVTIGNKCSIEGGTLLRSSGGKINLANNIYINRNCNIISRESITIGEGSSMGPNVCVYDHDHTFGKNKKENFKTAPINIGKNVWIGAGAIILKSVTIGDDSVVGAGAVISKDVPKNTIATVKTEIVLREIN